MLKDHRIKAKLVGVEVQLFFKKIKKILTPLSNTPLIQYLPLTPIQDADEDKAYTEMLAYAVSQQDINNIAITGPYGSGKSSVILTFQKSNPQWNYLNISLATFKDHNKEIETKEIDIETIEKSILQQLFYTVDQKTIPKSRLKRIETTTIWDLIQKTIFIMLWGLSFLIAFLPENKIFEKFEIIKIINQPIQQISLLAFLTFCIIGLFLGLKYIERVKEFKFKFHNSEITLNNNNNESILKKHLDEILYFFERTKFEIIIIEDLDRFENTEIFIRLRELNTLINNSQQIKRHIIFLYAIRDNIFIDKDRSKFFDFIVPVIPVINPTNAYELIRKNYINKKINKELNNQINDIFLNQISLYFDDLRLVTNIFNEFELYVKKLNKPNLDKNKLLAIIIYKNYYPSEFSKLHVNDGEIYHIFNTSKSTVISRNEKDLYNQLDDLDNIIENSNKEKLSSVNDLRKIYAYEIQRKIPKIQRINTNYYNASSSYNLVFSADEQAIDITNILSDEIFEIVKNSNKLNWEIEKNETNIVTTIENNNLSFSFSSIEKSINNEKSYNTREKDINNKNLALIKSIQDRRNSLIEKINTINHYTLKEILTDGNQDIFNNEKHPKLLQFLLREGYIDENYPEYISLFFNSVITLEERDYAQRVLNHTNSDFNQPLTNIQKILSRYLTARQFTHSSVLNFNLIDYVLNNKNNLKEHNSNLFKLLANEEERSKNFILLYIKRGKNLPEFINSIVVNWQNFFENILSSIASKEEVDKYLIVILKEIDFKNLEFLNRENSLSDYISEKEDFIDFIKNIYSNNQTKILQFLSSITPTFKYLTAESNDLNLFNRICEKEYFSFNKRIILKILLINNRIENQEEIQKTFNSMPYGVLQKFAPDYLKTQVDQSISHFFEKVYVSASENLSENSDNFIKLLNNEDLDNSHKEWLIENNEVQIDLISYIREAQFWKPILSENKVKPSWDSLISYYQYIENTLDDVIFDYINENNMLLKEQEISDTESKKSIPDITKKFEVALLESDSFSEIAYEAIIAARMFDYPSLNLLSLSNSKISLLINAKVLLLTSENVENFRKISPDYVRDIFVQNLSTDCKELTEEIVLENHEYELLLQSSELTHEQKLIIVKKLGINFYQESKIQSIINQIFKANKSNIPVDYINSFFEKTSFTQTRLKLLISEIPNLDHSNISTLLNMLDEPYRSITTKGHHSLSYSEQNDHLTKALEEIGYLNQLRTHKKTIQGIKSKSTISFAIKQ